MLTAHQPSGHVLGRSLPKGIPAPVPAALVGAVFPDPDMIWFHFNDDRALHHHPCFDWALALYLWLARPGQAPSAA